MNNNNNSKLLAVIALFFAVMCVSVAFAALSTTLKINGSANVQKSTWNVEFANLSSPKLTGAATAITPSLTSTSIRDFGGTLTTPGDSISVSFDVQDTGDYDAIISSVTILAPKCTGTGTNAITDAKNVCDYLTWSLKYDENDKDYANLEPAIGQKLNKGTSNKKTMILTITYDANKVVTMDLLPVNAVDVSNLSVSITYAQN